MDNTLVSISLILVSPGANLCWIIKRIAMYVYRQGINTHTAVTHNIIIQILRTFLSIFFKSKVFHVKLVKRDKCNLTRFQLYILAKTSDNNFLKLLDIFAWTHSGGLQREAKVKMEVKWNGTSCYFGPYCFTITYSRVKSKT